MTRVALVTGASRGIGRACALSLAKAGYHVVAVARSQKALESLDDEITALGGSGTFAPLDIKDYDALDRLGGIIYERWGRLDALVAAAGSIGELMPAHQFPPKMFEEAVAVNLIANARLIRSLDPLLRMAIGRAVFLTCSHGAAPAPFWGAAAASKAALEALVLSYAAEVGFTGVRVNLVDPGPVNTALRYKAFPGEDATKLRMPEDVADAVVSFVLPAETRHGVRVVLHER